jgi:hypothetical protein
VPTPLRSASRYVLRRALRERFPSYECCTMRPRSFQAKIDTVRLAMNALSSLVVARALLRFFRKRTAA